MGKKADIWEHYKANADDHSKVTCSVVKTNGEQCQMIISRGPKDAPKSKLGTTAMHNHLKKYHPELHLKNNKKE